MFPSDGHTAPADVELHDFNALPLKLTISCVNFEQRAEFQRTLFNIDQPSRCNTFEWAATGSNGIDHSSRALPDRSQSLGAFVDGQLQGLLQCAVRLRHRVVGRRHDLAAGLRDGQDDDAVRHGAGRHVPGQQPGALVL